VNRALRGVAAGIVGLMGMPLASASSPFDFTLQTAQGVSLDTKLKGEGTSEQHQLTFPELSLKMPLGERADVEFSTGLAKFEHDNGFERHGLGESKIKGRWILIAHDNAARQFRLTLRPELKIPAGRAGADPNRRALELDLPVMIGMRHGQWSTFAELGYQHDLHSSSRGKLPFRVGGAWHPAPELKLGLQLKATAPVDRLAEHSLDTKFAFEWIAAERLALQMEVSRVLQRPADALSTRLKLEIKYAFG